MKIDHYTRYLLMIAEYPGLYQIDDDSEEVFIKKVTSWLSEKYQVKYEFLKEYHNRLIRGGTWINVHKLIRSDSPTSSHAWLNRDFDKVLQKILYEIKRESSPSAD